MFKVGDRVILIENYIAVHLSKGEKGTVIKASTKIRHLDKNLIYVNFDNKKRNRTGCFDSRLKLLESQLLFPFMYES
jgi:hypothetical protein